MSKNKIISIGYISIYLKAISRAENNSTTDEILSDQQIIEALKDTGKVWDELFPIGQTRITRMFIRKVIIRPEGLDIKIYNEGLHLLTAELIDETSTKEAA